MKNESTNSREENRPAIRKEVLEIEVSKFSSYYAVKPSANIRLWDWLLNESEYTSIVQKLRETQDDVQKMLLKAQLPAITPSGIFNSRDLNGLVKHTGLICLDIDGKDNPLYTDMELLKNEISKNEFILYCGLSVSGKGLFCLVLIEFPEKHKGYFYALEKDFSEKGIVIDKACSDVSRLRGYSYDIMPFLNPYAKVYQKTVDCRETHILRPSKKTESGLNKDDVVPLKSHVLTKAEIFQSLLKPTEFYGSVIIRNKSEMVREIVERIISNRIDITESRADWILICSIMTNLFGEEGRILFHQISQFYPNYNQEINDRLYTDLLKKDYRGNSDKLFEIAAKHGIR